MVNFQFGLSGGKQDSDKGHGRFLAANVAPKNAFSPTSPGAKAVPKLGILNEITESPADKAHTGSSTHLSSGSKDSTLKNSDFEADSLEVDVTRQPSSHSKQRTETDLPTSSKSSKVRGRGEEAGTKTRGREEAMALPLPPHNSNLVVNYAEPEGSNPLSPIWNPYFHTNSDTSTNSEYITSYIGKATPLPNVPSPNSATAVTKKLSADSGHGESSDSELEQLRGGSCSEEGESDGADVRDGTCLKWKRGKLLGKGAYGKVWEGLLSSARMIAVKEVELDTASLERAQSVSCHMKKHPNSFHCPEFRTPLPDPNTQFQ